MRDYALDALAFMDSLGWSDATVLGESLGGMTALHLALLAPDRVTRLILASATACGPYASFDISTFLNLSREAAAAEALCLQDTRNIALREQDPDAFASRLDERMIFERQFAKPSIESGGYARLLGARRQHDCTRSLHHITKPVVVIAGRYDKQAPLASQQALAGVLSQSSIHVLEGGHGLLFNLPAASKVLIDEITVPPIVAEQNTRR